MDKKYGKNFAPKRILERPGETRMNKKAKIKIATKSQLNILGNINHSDIITSTQTSECVRNTPKQTLIPCNKTHIVRFLKCCL